MNPFKYGQVVSAGDFCSRAMLIRVLTGFIKSGPKKRGHVKGCLGRKEEVVF
jgi:hypothetical protein